MRKIDLLFIGMGIFLIFQIPFAYKPEWGIDIFYICGCIISIIAGVGFMYLGCKNLELG